MSNYRLPLKAKELLFVRAYVASGDATAAAIEAGYPRALARKMGRFLLANPEIGIAIRRRAIAQRNHDLDDLG